VLSEELSQNPWFRRFAEDETAVSALLLEAVPGYARIDQPGRFRIAEAAIEHGRGCAADFHGQTPSQIAIAKGLSLGRLPDQDWALRGYRAEYDAREKTMYLSESGIRDLASCLGLWEGMPPSWSRAREIAVAHELFHFIAGGNQKFRRAEEEIAAHAFVKALLNLAVTPLWFDWLTVWEREGRDEEAVRSWCQAVALSKHSGREARIP